MNQKKVKVIFFLIIILLIIVIFSMFFNGSFNNDGGEIIEENKYAYNFHETLDLENTNTFEEMFTPESDVPNFGVISDYYENTEMFYEGNKLYIKSSDGYDIYSTEWLDEGLAKNVKEPTFGYLEKFVLKAFSASARYSDVKMKDVINYINELSGLGFNNILKNEKNKKSDYYIYSATKADASVTLNYEKGSLYIEIY